jgi:hypothetical protein
VKTFLHSRDYASKGAALMIVLAFVVLLTGLALAYFSRTTTDRQLAQSSYNDTTVDLLARSALDIVVNDFKQEIIDNPTVSASTDAAAGGIQPWRYTPAPTAAPTVVPNLIRQSYSGDPTGRTSSINSAVASANGRSVSLARWNSHYLVPRLNPSSTLTDSTPISSFTAPDWVLVTAQGPNSAPTPSAVIGRYAFAVYDEGGLLDMTLAGFPDWPPATTGPPSTPTPTPWTTNVGRKGILAFADLTALPTSNASPAPTFPPTQINNIVGWRHFATTGQASGWFPTGTPSFSSNRKTQDTYGDYLLDFGEPPYTSPSPFPIYSFTSVATDVLSNRTDQAFITRQELLKLRSSLGFSQNVLQYMGTFSRERNRPAPDWNRLNGKLPNRYDMSYLGLVKPNPGGTPKPNRGKGGTKSRGRGRFRGDAASILDFFGLKWVDGMHTDPDTGLPMPSSDLRYWSRWVYIGRPGLPSNPNGNALNHIPALRGGRTDLFQILDYCIGNQANVDSDDFDQRNIANILGLGASLIDQYDFSGNVTEPLGDDVAYPAASPSPYPYGATPPPTHTTIIEYNNLQFVLGWENGDTNDPHTKISLVQPPESPAPSPLPTKPVPGFVPIVLNHAFTTSGDFGYGLKTEHPDEPFKAVDFHTAGSTDAPLLDFFTYNPVDSNYPRSGIANLNTRNWEVLAAIIKNTLKKDIDAYPGPSPSPTPAVIQSEAATAAQAIVAATTAQPVVNRSNIARLTAAAASAISTAGFAAGEETEKVPEAIARALSEMGQARTWNLMIDVIAQTGRYKPNAQSLAASDFIVEGEKRYWLHIALGRDLNTGAVDVVGAQLEEVSE